MSENKRSIYSKMPIFGSKSSEFSYKPLQQIERSSVTNSGASHVEQNIQQSGLSVNINLDGSADQLLTEFESSAAEEEQGIEYFSEGTSSVKNCSVEQVTNVKDKAEFTQIMKQQNIMLSHCMESAILLPEHDVNSLTDYEEIVCSGEEDAEYTEDNNSPIELDIEVSDLTKKYGELHVECVKDNSDVNLSQLATNEIKTKLFSSLQRRPQIPYITSVPEICFSLGQTSETDEIVNESNFKTLVNSEEMILPFDNVRETHVGDMIVSEEHKHQLDKSECKSHISVCENLWRIEECFVDLVKSKDELRAKTRIKGKDHQVNTETEDISSLGDEVEELVNEKFNNQDIGAVNVDSEFIKIFENTRVKSSSKCQSDVTFFFGKRHNDEVDDVGYHRRLTLPVIEKESTTDTEELSDVEQEHVINTKDCRLFNELQRPLFSVAFLPLRRLSYEVTTDIEELSEDDRIHRDSSMSINHNQQKCNVKSKKLSSVHHLNVVILSKMKDKTANVIEKSPRNVRSCTLAPLSLRSKQQVGMEQTTDDKFLYKDKKLRNDKNNMKGNPQKAYTQIQNLSASYHSLLLSDIIKEPVTDVEDLSEDDDKKEETSYKKSFVPDAFLPFNDIFQEQTTDIEELSGNEVQLDEKPHTSYRQLRKPFGPDAILKLNDMLQEQIIHVEKLSRYEEELDEKFQTSYRLLRKQSASDAFLTLNDMSQEPVTDVEELSGNEKELDEKPHTSCRRLRKPVASDVFLTLNDMLQEPVNGTELSGNEELDKKPQASYRWLRKSSASDEFLIPNYMLQEQITDVEELRGDEETAVKKPQTVYRQLRKPLYPDVFLSLYDVLQEPIAEVEKLSGIKEEVDKKPHTSYRWLQKPFAPDACLRLNDMLQEPVTDVEELSGNEEELDKKTQPSYRWLRKPSASDAFLSLYDMLQESITEVEELSGNEEDLDKKTQPSYRWLRRPSTHDAFLILNDNYSKNSINIDRDVTSVELSLKELQDSRKYSSVLLEDEDENQPFSRVTSVGTDSEDIIASEEEKDIMRNYHRSTVLHFEQNPYFTTEEKRKCVFPQSIDEERLSKECLYSITDLSDAITESEDMFFSDCEIPVYYFENSSCHLDSNLKVKYSDNSAVSSLGSETSTPHRNYLKVPISDVDLHTYTEDMFFSDISDSRSRSNSQQSESLHKEPESSEIAEQLKIQKIGKNYEKCIQKTKSRRKNKNDFRSSVDISIQHSEILSRAYIREKENSACVCIVPYNGNVINNVDPELNVCINKRNEEVEIKLQPENFEQNLEFLNDDVPSATAWAEKDESGAVQHTIQKEKQSTFTVKDGQSESHPGTENPVFHLKTQEPTSAAGQMLDSGTHQFHYRDVSDGVPLPASLTRHTVYPQDERTVQFDPRECDHEFHSKLLSHFISEEENKEFGSDDWQQDSGDGHWTDQSTTEVRLETTHTTTTVGAVTETTTQHSDINKQDSLQQSMQEILNQFMTDEGSSQTVYHFDNDKE